MARTRSLSKKQKERFIRLLCDEETKIQSIGRVGLDKNEGEILVLIRKAKRAIWNDTYGTCQECGSDIAFDRLREVPHAQNCLRCQTKLEQHHYENQMLEFRKSQHEKISKTG